MIDGAGSSAIKVYCDVGSSTVNRFNLVKKILWLGRDRICQFHFKDDPHLLGQGTIAFPTAEAIRRIRYSGFVNVETSSLSKDIDLDLRRNPRYLRGLFK
jgi:sugar phosphate isomerase/epimerase